MPVFKFGSPVGRVSSLIVGSDYEPSGPLLPSGTFDLTSTAITADEQTSFSVSVTRSNGASSEVTVTVRITGLVGAGVSDQDLTIVFPDAGSGVRTTSTVNLTADITSNIVGSVEIISAVSSSGTVAAPVIGVSSGSVTVNAVAPPPSGQTITASQVLGSGIGAVTFGQACRQGDFPGGNIAVNGAQVTVEKTHSDGSVAFAVISGILTGGQSYDIIAGAQSSGTNLTEAQLIAALGTTTISLSGNASGTINAANLISGTETPAAPGRLNIQDGQYCIERHVSAQISGTLYGAFHCRYYSNGAVRVRFVIENAEAISASANAVSGVTATFTLNGSQIYSGAVLGANNRFSDVGWVNGSERYGSMDKTYFDSCNIAQVYPAGATSAAEGTQTLAPYARGDHRETYGDTGAHEQLAVYARWDAACMSNGFTETGIIGCINNALAVNHRPVIFKDSATGYPIDPNTYPQANTEGWGGVGNPLNEGSGGLFGDSKHSHMPSSGFLAYVITGDYYFAETAAYWAFYAYGGTGASTEYNERNSSNFKIKLSHAQHRQSAWRLRNVVDAARCLPDSHPWAAISEKIIEDTINDLYSSHVVGASDNQFGWIDSSVDGLTNTRPWQHNWLHAAIFEVRRSGLGGANIDAVCLWCAPWIQNLMSRGSSPWCRQDSPMYSHDGLPAQGGTEFATDWADFYSQRHGSQSCDLNGLWRQSRYSENATDYGGMIAWTVMVAYQIGLLDVAETDWFLNAFTTADFANQPEWSMTRGEQVAQLDPLPSSAPSWYSGATINQFAQMPGSMINTVGASQAIIYPWCSMAVCQQGIYNNADDTLIDGTFLLFHGTGHNDFPTDSGLYAFGPLESETPQSYVVAPDTHPTILATHTYDDIYWNPVTNEFGKVATGSRATNGFYSSQSARLPLGQAYSGWTIDQNNPTSGAFNPSISAVDPSTGITYCRNSANGRPWLAKDPNTGNFTQLTTNGAIQIPAYGCATFDTARDRVVYMDGDGNVRYLDINNVAAGEQALSLSASVGTSSCGFTYDSTADRYYVWQNGYGNSFRSINPDNGQVQTISGGVDPGLDPGFDGPGYSTGTYDRWSYIAIPALNMRLIVLVQQYNELPYFVRLQ